ncbi:MAG: 3D domain-containing protein [Tepidisphaeraceae bacterium]
MQTTSLTSSQQIIRRVLVAACVIFTLGVAGTVVGRAASGDQSKQPAEAATPVVEEASVQLASDKIAPAILEKVALAPEVLSAEFVAPASIVPVVIQPKTRTIEMEVTAYCPCTKCCGPRAQGITASGKHVSHNDGLFVAADRKFAFGTKLLIPGYAAGNTVEVLDRGGAIKGNKLDVYFHSHQEALKWGRQKLTVTVIDG